MRIHSRALAAALLAFALAGCVGVRREEESPPEAPAAASAPAPSGSTARKRDPIAKVSLLSDVAAITPGERFWLGVRFEIPEGWHIYGKDPGDAGYPTKVKLHAPEGFTAGETGYPETHRFESPGNIVSFGYEKETLLLVPVDPPATLPEGSVHSFHVAASWLSCRDLCVKESGDATLEIPVVGPDRPPTKLNETLFATYRNRLAPSQEKN